MKKTSFLWLLAGAALIILAVLVMRPPAWATPVHAGQRAASIAPEANTPLSSNVKRERSSFSHPGLTSGPGSALDETGGHSLVADTPSSDNCIACHTDKKKLKKLAREPEEVKSEKASGEG